MVASRTFSATLLGLVTKGPRWCNDGDVVLPCLCVYDLFSLARSLLHIITQGHKVHVFLFKGVLFR